MLPAPNVRKKISVITPCLNEEENVVQCYEAVQEVFAEQLKDYDWEHIFCDNDSSDGTVELLRELARNDKRVKVILNSRNFGPLRSNFNGLLSASGDAVIVFLPADLQDPPELIPQFVMLWEQGHDVVYGIRKKREEGVVQRTLRWLFYRIVNRLSATYLPPDVGEFQLIDKKVQSALRQFEDHHPYIRGLIASCGFKAKGVPYVWRARRRGASKANLYGLIDQAINAVISFSTVPVRLCLFTGLLIALGSVVAALVELLSALFGERTAPPGIPTLIIALFFFSGVNLFVAGFLGEYVVSIHSQVRKRPLVIEKERINFDE